MRQAVGYTRRSKARPAYYALIYERLRVTARIHGYALALHGSLSKDMDLLAVPWVKGARAGSTLAKAVAAKIDGLVMKQNNPGKKPHGRLAWTILFGGGGTFIDLSIMPRK